MEYEVGNTIHVEDEISGDLDLCTIVYIEYDYETHSKHFYVQAVDDKELNINYDAKFPEAYWKILSQKL